MQGQQQTQAMAAYTATPRGGCGCGGQCTSKGSDCGGCNGGALAQSAALSGLAEAIRQRPIACFIGAFVLGYLLKDKKGR